MILFHDLRKFLRTVMGRFPCACVNCSEMYDYCRKYVLLFVFPNLVDTQTSTFCNIKFGFISNLYFYTHFSKDSIYALKSHWGLIPNISNAIHLPLRCLPLLMILIMDRFTGQVRTTHNDSCSRECRNLFLGVW